MKEVAGQYAVSTQTLHAWLGRYEADGLEGLSDRSHQMPAAVEVAVLGRRTGIGGHGGSSMSWVA